jgi:propionyl-CoA synthetase
LPMGFIVLKTGVNRPHSEIEADAIKLVRDQIGPVAAFKSVLVVQRLPKTRSGKTLRGTLRQLADVIDVKVPATIDDPAILAEITAALAARTKPMA